MKKRPAYYQIIPFLRPHWQMILLGFFWMVIFNGCWPLLAWLAGQISQYLSTDVIKLAQIAIAGCGAFIFQGIAQYGMGVCMAKATFGTGVDIQKRVYSHLLRLSNDYFSQTPIGDLTYRFTGDIEQITASINKFLHELLPCVLQLIVVLGYMIYLNWQLTLAVLIMAPVIGFLVGWFGEKLQEQSRRSQNQIADLAASVTEDFSGIRLIQAFATEDYSLQRFVNKAETNRLAKYRTEHAKAVQYPIISFLQVSSILLVFVLAGWQIQNKYLTTASFVAYLTNIVMLISPIGIVTNNFSVFKQSQASIDRVFELLAVQPSIVEKNQAVVLPTIEGRVEYRDVTFGYQPSQPILEHLDLTVLPGELVALVGTSGAGKTTVVSLLNRFYDVQAGGVFVDGVDVRDVTLASLRRQIGIVPQETILFSGTIAENIAFGQTNFEMKAVEEAAKIANAHQFISQLSQGYQTRVGERGANFSGGQRQRLAIARAVLLDPRILILDEATSALDSESEALVQEALERIMVGRTTFIIAHRLATVRRANRILVVEKGKIIEAGSHGELLTLNGRYARFYAQQFS
jgi:ATP-binding cassette, subfamily B, bacterial